MYLIYGVEYVYDDWVIENCVVWMCISFVVGCVFLYIDCGGRFRMWCIVIICLEMLMFWEIWILFGCKIYRNFLKIVNLVVIVSYF